MDALTCLTTRRSVPRLVDPAPDQAAVDVMIAAAACAPDHGQLQPWRLVIITGEGRQSLGEVFARALGEREPDSDPGAIEKVASKPLRAPMLIAVIHSPVTAADAWNGKHIPAWEQLAAASAAAQNLGLAAHALGYGSMWRTGWFGDAPAVRQALGMGEDDVLVGWLYLGTTPDGANPVPRRDPNLAQRVSTWP